MLDYFLYLFFVLGVISGVTAFSRGVYLLYRKPKVGPRLIVYSLFVRGIFSIVSILILIVVYLKGYVSALPVLLIATFIYGCELIAVKLRGPMTLSTGLCRRAKLLNGRRDWTRKRIQRNGNHLSRPGELGLDIPTRSRPDMALGAGYLRVRRLLIRRELRLHDGMANLSAEIVRVGVMVAFIAENPDHRDRQGDARRRHDDVASVAGIVEVQAGIQMIGAESPVSLAKPAS